MNDTDFMTHIIGDICDFAVKNNMKPDDLLSDVAENIMELLEAVSFNNWKPEKEGDPE